MNDKFLIPRKPEIVPIEPYSRLGVYYTRVPVAGMDCSGGPRLQEFWRRYRAWMPEHEMWGHSHFDTSALVPLMVHGDGGRTFKKDELMVLQFQPVIGFGTRTSHPLPQTSVPGVNLRKHTFTTRFLYGVLQKAAYKDNPACFTGFFDTFMQNLAALYLHGLNLQNKHLHFLVIGVKGDLPFLQKAAHLERTFLNVRKAPEKASSKPLNGCCHLCLAGTAGFPFEEFNRAPKFVETMGACSPYPWSHLPPFVEYIPHVRANPAALLRLDLMHIVHLGVGRDYTGSSCVVMLGLYEDATSVSEAIDCLSRDLKQFLRATKRQLHFRCLSRDMLGYANESSFPTGHWSKAADTPVMFEFIIWLLEQHSSKRDQDKLLRVIAAGAHAMGIFMRTVLGAGLWLTRDEATAAAESGHHFLACYKKCASICYERKQCRYNLTPKLHFWHHICLQLQHDLSRTPTLQFFPSPLWDANFSDEDFVGRVARLSRRVSPRLLNLRTIGRYLTATRAQLQGTEGG